MRCSQLKECRPWLRVSYVNLRVRCCGKEPSNDRQREQRKDPRQYDSPKRRRGRPAYLRSSFDTPLRDGNRDRLIGLLTKRSAVTLSYYLMETNVNLHHWLMTYMEAHPIPTSGTWEDVSGESFLRSLLTSGVESTKASQRDPMFDCSPYSDVDPRSIAQRIMAIRSDIAREFIEELQNMAEENNTLYRETLEQSLSMSSSEEED